MLTRQVESSMTNESGTRARGKTTRSRREQSVGELSCADVGKM